MATSPSSSLLRTWPRQILRGVLDLIYPPTCHLCGKALSEDCRDFCNPCAKALVQDDHVTCPRCALTVGPYSNLEEGCLRCRSETFHFERTIRLGPYVDLRREAVLKIKHAAGEGLAHALGRLWIEKQLDAFQEVKADFVVPVPLHWLRRFQRGYNQAQTLASALAAELGVPCRSRWLWRKRHTPHQTGQSVTARKENVRGAFQSYPRKDLRGKTILLVDDVMTTGSTCSEAARALKKAGAGRIIVAVVARSDS